METEIFIVLAILSTGLLVSGAHSDNGETGSHQNPLRRYRRSASCADKFQTIPHHTACLDKSSKASNSGVDLADQKVIVDLHNKYRADVSASNMLKLTWDAQIATIAQKWADNCETKHDSNERRYIPECATTCLNSGELIRANCTCKCRRDFYTGNGCALDCDKVKKDPGYCSGDYGKKDCTISGLDCPNKCHVCPYSGFNYKEGSTPIAKRSDNNTGASARCDILMAVTMTTLVWMTTITF